MWQTTEYKAAAIEQFRKGDLLQRVIEDVQSEAANAAEWLDSAQERLDDDYPMLESVITNIMKEKGVNLPDVTIVSGGAKGADSLGRDFAHKHGTKYLEFLPDWGKFGKSAGVIRLLTVRKKSYYRRAGSHAAAAGSADEALAAVANFEKYLLPDSARAAEQAAPTPRLRMRWQLTDTPNWPNCLHDDYDTATEELNYTR
ncbi:MAG: DUF2493 domain-containing protein [Desulfovibrio sp.]|jgi:hypothetical protein|nr:DUF2493 domain-containing protein [Desulfovibrio sp.]